MKRPIMLMMLAILSGICLSSCNDPDGFPKIADQEQLTTYFEYVEIDGKEYIDVEKSVCFSRVYRVSKGFVGSIGQEIDLNIKECNKVIGYAPSEYGIFATWLENFRHWLLGF